MKIKLGKLVDGSQAIYKLSQQSLKTDVKYDVIRWYSAIAEELKSYNEVVTDLNKTYYINASGAVDIDKYIAESNPEKENKMQIYNRISKEFNEALQKLRDKSIGVPRLSIKMATLLETQLTPNDIHHLLVLGITKMKGVKDDGKGAGTEDI